MKFKFVVMSILISPFFAYAGGDFWGSQSLVSQIYPHSGGLTFILDTYSNPISLCDASRRFLVPLAHPNYKVLAASLLSAQMANKLVLIHVDSNQSPTCEPNVDRFIVYK